MWFGIRSSFALFAAILLLTFAVSGGMWRYAYVQGLGQAASKAEADLALAADRLEAQIAHVRELAVLLSDHPVLHELAEQGGDPASANELLLQTLDKTALLDISLVDTQGSAIASAFVDKRAPLGNEPYFERAMDGALGFDHITSADNERRAFIFAAPVFSSSGLVMAAVIVAMDVERFESSWRGSRPAILFTDADGLVFISNRSELVLLERDGGKGIPVKSKKRVSEFDIWQIQAGPYIPSTALHVSRSMPVVALTAEALVDVQPTKTLALWQAGFAAAMMMAFGVILFVLVDRRQRLADANLELEQRVSERTEALENTNARLLNEVLERKEAEYALKQAQVELVQAGKLSALGQMSAGISHELNQPLMAIQTYAENGDLFLERNNTEGAAENLRRISELANRMDRIIKNLRAFAKQEAAPATSVDVVTVVNAALELSAGKLQNAGVTLNWSAPKWPVVVRGGEVRLQQVMLNLIGNAVDAMIEAGSDPREVTITLEHGKVVRLSVRDTGPGIDEPEKIFDPFYTTKAVGASEGMGLGLSISYGMVQSFGGAISGQNAPDGGAIFTIELQPWSERGKG